MKKAKKHLITIVGIIIAITIVLLGCRSLKQKQILKQSLLNCNSCIDSLATFSINNAEITSLIRSTDTLNPLLMFVHGGPGMPDMPFARTFDSLLVKDFIVVHYDQRGIGKSLGTTKTEEITIEDNITDVIEISKELHSMFPHNKIILVGQSWGTLLGISAIEKSPALFDAYVGIGQIVNLQLSDIVSYDYALEKAKEQKNKKALDVLLEMNRETYNKNFDSLILQRHQLAKVGGRFYSNDIVKKMMKAALFSPEYSLKELLQIKSTNPILDEMLYPQMLTYNFFESADSLSVPVYFISGKCDYQVPITIAQQYYKTLKCKDKKFFTFNKSGHIPNYEEPELFYRTMLEIKKEILQYK